MKVGPAMNLTKKEYYFNKIPSMSSTSISNKSEKINKIKNFKSPSIYQTP